MPMNISKPTIAFISLGCAKALVDTEQMMGAVAMRGFPISFDPDAADLVIINTCSFIEPARRESFDVIREYEEKKRKGEISALFVVGCLPQLLGRELHAEFDGVDEFIPLNEIPRIADTIGKRCEGRAATSCPKTAQGPAPRLLATPPHTAYLKIAEGCDNCCSYCLIPRIRGPLVSRPAESIILEARQLAEMGVKELNVIAQDVAAWGRDLRPWPDVAKLLRELCGIDEIEWIRLLYTHPASIDGELIEIVAANEEICNYFDIPIQHSEDRILTAMNRRITKQGLVRLISGIRAAIPDAVLRTTVMVGFPGETEAEFEGLMGFLKTTRFDRLGVFAYCRESCTPCASLNGQIPDEVKQERLDAVMRLQAEISLDKNEKLIGAELDVIIDEARPCEKGRGPYLIGRTRAQAPDVDGVIRIRGSASPGAIVRAVITSADPYDLEGKLL